VSDFRIIMVCMGNICRSPAAEVVLRQKLAEAHIDGVTVDSAGTGGWHEGDGADPRSKATWERRGYTGRHTARQFRREWFDERDLILVMDSNNYETLLARTTNDEHRAKVRYFRSYDPGLRDIDDIDLLEVPDPYYGGPQGFEHMLDLIERACDGLVDDLRSAH
jgi:protein-tyrosine phosphatase